MPQNGMTAEPGAQDPPTATANDALLLDEDSQKSEKGWRRAREWVSEKMNFYRTHMLAFILIPLLVSIVFYLSNGQYEISYIDSLFVCISSFTVTGLATVELSQLTGFQQAILYVLMWFGNPIMVSLLIIKCRMWMMQTTVAEVQGGGKLNARARAIPLRKAIQLRWREGVLRVKGLFGNKAVESSKSIKGDTDDIVEKSVEEANSLGRTVSTGKVHAGMIRRMSDAPQRINPSGFISEATQSPKAIRQVAPPELVESPAAMSNQLDMTEESIPTIAIRNATIEDAHWSSGAHRGQTEPSQLAVRRLPSRYARSPSVGEEGRPNTGVDMNRTTTVEFAPMTRNRATSVGQERGSVPFHATQSLAGFSQRGRSVTRNSLRDGSTFERVPTHAHSTGLTMGRRTITGQSYRSRPGNNIGFGGFPGPIDLIQRFFRWVVPRIEDYVPRGLPRSRTLVSEKDFKAASEKKSWIAPHVPTSWLRRGVDVTVVGNSNFINMSETALMDAYGVEYRALQILFRVVATYLIGFIILGTIILVPYSMQDRWLPVLQAQWRFVPPAWFAAFQAASAFTNTGTSLSDTSMVPFQRAYPMIFVMFFLIVAGNTGFPIMLRLVIWILSKIWGVSPHYEDETKSVSSQSPQEDNEGQVMVPTIGDALQFLLDHPRRCYIYLFPSHQTWFLLTMIIILNCVDWFCFLVLDIGDPVMETIPIGTRFAIGLLQASAVRAAGFATVSLSALAPAVKVLYVVMMYISVYPIAMSVRSTNVYEERALGIFTEEEEAENATIGSPRTNKVNDETMFEKIVNDLDQPRAKIWGSYLAFHARQQLAFDMWWLALAVWLICIIEKDHLINEENLQWYSIFTILFEITSAYGTVGLSLGVPFANFSTSGFFHPLSKLIVCAVMIRGRHRGLPVAIDRAVMFRAHFANELARRNGYQTQPEFTMDMHGTSSVAQESIQRLPRTITGASLTSQAQTSTSIPSSSLLFKGSTGLDLNVMDTKLRSSTMPPNLATVPESAIHTPMLRPTVGSRASTPSILEPGSQRSSFERVRFDTSQSPPPRAPTPGSAKSQ